MKNLKQRLKKGETIHGCWLNSGSAHHAEMIGLAGFDWVMIDLEHGSGNEKDVSTQIKALENSPTGVLVRVENSTPARISRVMDMGAEGIMVPKVNNAAEARRLVSGLHYPPIGNRGIATHIRPAAFGPTFQHYYDNAEKNHLGIAQIETLEALENVEEIANTSGIDILFIGPADLTIDMGIFLEFENPLYINAIKNIVAAANKAGKATGILFFNPDEYRKYHNLGIRFIACGSEESFLMNGANEMAKKLNYNKLKMN